MPKTLIICTQAWHRIKLVTKRCLLYPPGLTDWHSPLLDHRESAGCCPERLTGGWGGTVHLLFDLHAVITFTNTHTQSWTNKHACPHHPTLCKVHCKRLTHKEQECYIFITDVINTECPKLFWGVLIVQQKGLITSINQWPHWITEIQVKKTQ